VVVSAPRELGRQLKGSGIWMGNWKVFSRFAAAMVVLCLALAPTALAYSVPGKPGTPGGKPTKPTGGGKATKSGAGKIGTAAAGYTGSELAQKGKISVSIKVKKAGTLSGTMKAGTTLLGKGSAKATKAGKVDLTITFSSSGKSYLNKHNGKAIDVTISVTFKPKSGASTTSISTVVLDA
jgi:hypothetical protein